MFMKHNLLIGKSLTVVDSTNKSLIGLSGRVVDETLGTIVIECDKGFATLIKQTSTFNIESEEVNGQDLLCRPHERLKQKWKIK